MAEELKEKLSDDGQSTSIDPVAPEGGKAKQSSTGADLKKKVDPEADEVKEEVSNDFSSIFEGMDLSEDFKEKASLVFEAAVNEAATEKALSVAEEIEESIREEFEVSLNEATEEFQSSLDEAIEEVVENLDGYLDYIVKEWMNENELAIESGIKVEMAESFMDGLKELFYEHNVEIDEDTVDVVSALEEELDESKRIANKAINVRLDLEEEVQKLRAEKLFFEMTEGLSAAQIERFRILAEKVDNEDLDEYVENLNTLKESFFKKKESVLVEDLDTEGEELITEEEIGTKTLSSYDSVNAYARALEALK
jgi:hypothetical protein